MDTADNASSLMALAYQNVQDASVVDASALYDLCNTGNSMNEQFLVGGIIAGAIIGLLLLIWYAIDEGFYDGGELMFGIMGIALCAAIGMAVGLLVGILFPSQMTEEKIQENIDSVILSEQKEQAKDYTLQPFSNGTYVKSRMNDDGECELVFFMSANDDGTFGEQPMAIDDVEIIYDVATPSEQHIYRTVFYRDADFSNLKHGKIKEPPTVVIDGNKYVVHLTPDSKQSVDTLLAAAEINKDANAENLEKDENAVPANQ